MMMTGHKEDLPQVSAGAFAGLPGAMSRTKASPGNGSHLVLTGLAAGKPEVLIIIREAPGKAYLCEP